MKKLVSFLLIFLFTALLLSPGYASSKSVPDKKTFELAYKVGPGKSFTMKSEGTTTIKSEQMGQSITIDMVMANEAVCRVLSGAPGGNMQYEMEFKSRKQSAKSEMGGGETDFSAWIGKKVGFNLSPRGALSGFQGFDQLPAIAGATGEKVTGQMVQASMSDQFFMLPDHPVKIGETWTVKDSSDIPYGSYTLKKAGTTTYTAVETATKDGMDCLKIDVTASVKLSGTFEQQGNQLELTRETKSTGVIYFAIEKGRYINIETTSVGHSEINVPAASMTIPQEITGKSSLKVVFN